MLEFLGRFLVETLFQGLLVLVGGAAHALVRLLAPLLTAGRVKVAPLPGAFTVVSRWHGVHRLTDGTPVLSERLATAIGLLLIVFFLAAVIVIAKSA